MTKRTRRTFSPEFKLEAAKAMNVSKSAMDKWVRQLKQEGQVLPQKQRSLHQSK